MTASKKDVLLMVESISNKIGVDKQKIFETVEEALATVAAKAYSEEVDLRVSIDRKSGDYQTFRRWTVLADDEPVEFSEKEISLSEAHETDANLNVGDVIEEEVESIDLGRIGAQQAKQVIAQKVRELERHKIVSNYSGRVGELVIGVVKRVTRDHIILDMGENAEALLLREDMIPREAFRTNDRLRAYLYKVREEKRGPQLLVSRTHPQFLVELFKIEVPEIGEEVIEIMGAARDAGSRAKIAVKTNDGRIDPIGACVGMRGSRVQAVSNELNGERIDIILWDDNPAQLVINAMAPAEVRSIVVDEESHTMDIAVDESQLSQAIGRSGQNVRLASELTGWTLNVMNEQDATLKQESESKVVRDLFMEKLDVDADVADVLVAEGFTSLEEVAYVPLAELTAVEGFDGEIAEELQRRASEVLLTQEIADQESMPEPAKDLLEVAGMNEPLAFKLASHGIVTRDDLAEQSIDELAEILDLDEKQLAELIMSARSHWFAEEEE